MEVPSLLELLAECLAHLDGYDNQPPPRQHSIAESGQWRTALGSYRFVEVAVVLTIPPPSDATETRICNSADGAVVEGVGYAMHVVWDTATLEWVGHLGVHPALADALWQEAAAAAASGVNSCPHWGVVLHRDARILLSPRNYDLWAGRKRQFLGHLTDIENTKHEQQEGMEHLHRVVSVVCLEGLFVDLVAGAHPKIPEVWEHRAWLVDGVVKGQWTPHQRLLLLHAYIHRRAVVGGRLPAGVGWNNKTDSDTKLVHTVFDEFTSKEVPSVVEAALAKHPRNYHAWSYRLRVVTTLLGHSERHCGSIQPRGTGCGVPPAVLLRSSPLRSAILSEVVSTMGWVVRYPSDSSGLTYIGALALSGPSECSNFIDCPEASVRLLEARLVWCAALLEWGRELQQMYQGDGKHHEGHWAFRRTVFSALLMLVQSGLESVESLRRTESGTKKVRAAWVDLHSCASYLFNNIVGPELAYLDGVREEPRDDYGAAVQLGAWLCSRASAVMDVWHRVAREFLLGSCSTSREL